MATTNDTITYILATPQSGEFSVLAKGSYATIDDARAAIDDLQARQNYGTLAIIEVAGGVEARYPITGEIYRRTCLYCEQETDDHTLIPEVGDDEAWGDLAGEHADDCEWLTTRAHRLAD